MRRANVIAGLYLLALGGCFVVLEDYSEYQRVDPDAGTPDTGTPPTCSDPCYPPALGGMPGVGECKFGQTTCDGDVVIGCSGAVGPSPEICDTTAGSAKDEDCSGTACVHSARWEKRLGDAAEIDEIDAVAATNDGGVVFSGFFTGTFNLGGGKFVSAGAPGSSFVAMLDSMGGPVWISRPVFNGNAEVPVRVRDIAVNATGTIFLTGTFVWTNGARFGYMDILNPSTGVGMSPNEWGEFVGAEGESMAVAAAPNGDAVVVGTAKGLIVPPCGATQHMANTPDLLLLRANSANLCLWSKVFPNGPHAPTDVAVRGSNEIVVVGTHGGVLEGVTGASPAQPFGFVLHTSSDGMTTHFIRSIVPTGSTMAQVTVPAVTVDGGDNIFVTGTVRYGATIQGLEGQPITADPEGDAFVLALDSLGAVKWVRPLGGAGEQRGLDIAFHDKRLFVSGSFNTALDVGPGTTLPSTRGPFWVELDVATGSVKWAHTLAQSSAATQSTDHLLLAPLQGGQPGIVLAGTTPDPVLLHEIPLAGTSIDVFMGVVETP